VPPLASDADLAAIQTHAQQRVVRAELLASLAKQAAAVVSDAPGLSDADRAAADDAATKAQKAATTARSSSGLLALDDDEAGARITLDLVARAEQQAEAATVVAHKLAVDIVARAHAMRAAEDARRRLMQQAEEHAARASGAAEAAAALVATLETRREAGELSASDAIAAIQEAWTASQGADQAANRALDQLDQLRKRGSGSLDVARTAADDAQTQASLAQQAAQRAQRAEAEAMEALAPAAQELVRATEASSERAARARDRAQADAGALNEPQSTTHAASAAEAAARAQEAANKATELVASLSSMHTLTASAACLQRLTELASASEAHDDAAQQACNQIAALAGAAAEAEAAKARTRDLATSALATFVGHVTQTETALERCQATLAPLEGTQARTELATAEEGFGNLQTQVTAMHDQVSAIESEAGLAALQGEIERLQAHAQAVQSHIDQAHEEAADELAELADAQAQQAALQRATEAAALHSLACRAAADDAAARNLSARATMVGISGPIDGLLARAEEIVDIALFQASEAEQSAAWAMAEHEPSEAQAHADTAASFAERIALDLPEALNCIDEAESLAAKHRQVMAACRDQASAMHAEVQESASTLHARAEATRTALNDAHNGDLTRPVQLFEEAAVSHAQALETLGVSFAAVEAADSPASAESRLEVLRQGAARCASATEQLEDRLAVLERGIQHALSERQALAHAAEQASDWTTRAIEADATATEHANTALSEAKRQQASGAAVNTALLAAQQAAAGATDARVEVEACHQRILEQDDSDHTQPELARMATALAAVESARDQASTASRLARQAAEEEAAARVAHHQRRIEMARVRLDTTLQNTQAHLERVASKTSDAAGEVQQASGAVVAAEAASATRKEAEIQAAVTAIQQAVTDASELDDPERVEAMADDAEAAADRAEAAANAAIDALHRAQDLARNQAAEADALARVASEAQDAVQQAQDAVSRTKEAARGLIDLPLSIDAKRALAKQAKTEIKAAERAAAKVAATADIIGQTDSLDTAQALLSTCRATIALADGGAEAIRDRVAQAAEAAREAAEAAAAALQVARNSVREPLNAAITAADRARSMVDEVSRLADAASARAAIASHLDALQACANKVNAAAQQATAHAESLDTLDTVDALEHLAGRLQDDARQTEVFLQQCESARSVTASALLAYQEAEAQRQKDGVWAAATAKTAHQAATQARALTDELDTWLALQPHPGDRAREHLATAHEVANNAREAVVALDALSEAPTPHTRAQGKDLLERALNGLASAIEEDGLCRASAATHDEAHAREQARIDAERREQASRAAAIEAAKTQAQEDRDTDRKRRLDERRSRFERRRRDSVEPPKPQTPPQGVKNWAPGQGTKATSAKSRGRPRPSQAQKTDRPEGSTAADALLERLRDRHRKD
jgi:hypothetical protein